MLKVSTIQHSRGFKNIGYFYKHRNVHGFNLDQVARKVLVDIPQNKEDTTSSVVIQTQRGACCAHVLGSRRLVSTPTKLTMHKAMSCKLMSQAAYHREPFCRDGQRKCAKGSNDCTVSHGGR